jgi:hypothetical protein
VTFREEDLTPTAAAGFGDFERVPRTRLNAERGVLDSSAVERDLGPRRHAE